MQNINGLLALLLTLPLPLQETPETNPVKQQQPEPRIWTDINGKQLEGTYVSSNTLNVTLRLQNGTDHTFPIAGFRTEDQQLIRVLHQAEHRDAPGSANPANLPPAGSPGVPGQPQIPGGPAAPGASAPPQFPPASGSPGSPDGIAGSIFQDGSGINNPPGGSSIDGAGMPPAIDASPLSQPSQPGFPANTQDDIPPGVLESPASVFQCANCGALSMSADSVSGSVCEKCPWYTRIRGRGVTRMIGYVGIGLCAVIGWVIKKLFGSN